MSSQTISEQRTNHVDAHPAPAEGGDRPLASRSTAPPQSANVPRALLSRLPHPRGHVIGHRVGRPLPRSLDGHPCGHVIGHRIGRPLPPSLAGRPRGHVVGHAVAPHPRR